MGWWENLRSGVAVLKESHCIFRGLAQQEDGLSHWKAAFEPHVSSLKIPISLSSPRTRLEPLLPLQALATKPQLSCAAPKVEILSFCEVLWASPASSSLLLSQHHNSGMRGWVGHRFQPAPLIYNCSTSPILCQAQ